ncbi:hypothetical protein N0V93_006995 [Gnomoniopsis smithogilvyi]|uniref:RGS domain-containing protein n=1 Tax=Gnomoniopsis smithogilvyi TaxID=1191159 RepID=A0A9W9CW65_9PEZI|nr:hypothetical protein N0V93_006995 [Gnomoniopsis smithogilvyi]
MATDHDVILNQVLPHVDSGVITKAQQYITELNWDDSDSADRDTNARSTPTHSFVTSRAESVSSLSYTGISGGLSPPRRRRPVTFTDFDGHYVDKMVEGLGNSDSVGAKLANGNARQSPDVKDIDMTELSRQLSGHLPQSLRPSPVQSTSRHGMDSGGNHHVADVPVRQSSKGERNTNGASFGHSSKTTPAAHSTGIKATESDQTRVSVILEDDNDVTERDDGDDEEHMPPAQYKAPSRYRQDRSSTPPPIRNGRPNRVLMYDSFEEDVDVSDEMDDNAYESNDSQPARRRSAAPSYENRRKPPLSSRSHERRLNSLTSEGMRTPKSGVRGSPMSGVHGPHGRTAGLAANYQAARTPMLDHVRLYQDAEPSKPLPDRHLEARNSSRQPQQQARGYRSIDDAMFTGYSGGLSAGGPEELASRMPLRRPYSDDEISVRQQSISGKTTMSATSQSALPDFFSPSIFHVVLHNPTTAHQLLKFSETRLCSENVEFLSKVDEYRTTLNNLASQMAAIHKTFISPGSHSQINVNGTLLRQTHKEMKSLINSSFPAMETVFTDLQEQIETLVFQDIYPRFVRHQMALSATKALGSDRFKYQGLGDCFTLTDPNIADNPILYASDGFVKVTGYTRTEIIPRNCRFLQGPVTDRQPVRRLKQAIEDRKESPLYDAKGKIAFFIGGQVNCSTTIHSNVDVMKVLSLSSGEEAEGNESLRSQSLHKQAPPTKASARRALLKAFGVRVEEHAVMPTGDAGMEDGVLNRMEGQDLSSQMKEFYTAYSKYLVVRASNFNIDFYSDGVVEALNPANMAGSLIVGSEVFRFFGQNMLTKQNDYKTRVKNAIRAGLPTTTPLRLQTRRSAVFRGDEAFLAHWTPLKDEKANVSWIVVTLAAMA